MMTQVQTTWSFNQSQQV